MCLFRGVPHLHPIIYPSYNTSTGPMSVLGVPSDWSLVPSKGVPCPRQGVPQFKIGYHPGQDRTGYSWTGCAASLTLIAVSCRKSVFLIVFLVCCKERRQPLTNLIFFISKFWQNMADPKHPLPKDPLVCVARLSFENKFASHFFLLLRFM